MNIIIFPILLIVMYLVLLRPQQRRVRQQQQLITAIDVGDHIVTAGGLIGRVVALTDQRLRLEIADGVVVDMLRIAISRRLEPSEEGENGTPAFSESGLDDEVVPAAAGEMPAPPASPVATDALAGPMVPSPTVTPAAPAAAALPVAPTPPPAEEPR